MEATVLIDRCREIFNRFQDECVDVELLPEELVDADLETGRAVLLRLRDSLAAELMRRS